MESVARETIARSVLDGRELTAQEQEFVSKTSVSVAETKRQLQREQSKKAGELYEFSLRHRIFDKQKWDGPSGKALVAMAKLATRWVYMDFVDERVVFKTGGRGIWKRRDLLGPGERELTFRPILPSLPINAPPRAGTYIPRSAPLAGIVGTQHWKGVHIFLSAAAARIGVGIKVPTEVSGVHVVFPDGRILDAHVNHGPRGTQYRVRLHDSLYLEVFSPTALEAFESLGAFELERPNFRILPLVSDSKTWNILESRLSSGQLVKPSVISKEGLREVFRANRGSFMVILAHQLRGKLMARVTAEQEEVPLEIEEVVQLAKAEGVNLFLTACNLAALRGEGPLNAFALRAMANSLTSAAEARTLKDFFELLATPETPLIVGYETVHGAHRAYARVRVWRESSHGKSLILAATAMAFLSNENKAKTVPKHDTQGVQDAEIKNNNAEETYMEGLVCP